MELAREIVPGANKIGLLTNLHDPKAPPQALELTAAAKASKIEIATADANRPEEINGALQALTGQRVDVIIVLQTSMLLSERDQIVAWESANKLPMVFGYPQYTRGGGLVSYGVDLAWCFYRTAYFVDKYCVALHLAICRSSSRAICCWWSISKRPNFSASPYPRLCSFEPTR